MPAGKPPRIHIVVVYAKDRMIGGNPDPARTNAKTIDLKCDTNQFFLWEDRTLDVAKKRVGGRLAMAYLNASELLDLEPLSKQGCAGALPKAKDHYGTIQQAIDWLTAKIA